MDGPKKLSSKKGLLTRYCNNVSSLLDTYIEFKQSMEGPHQVSANNLRIKELVLQLHSTSQLVSEALFDFTTTIDSLADSLTPEHQQQADVYIEKAEAAIDNAQKAAIELEAKRISALDEGRARNTNAPHLEISQTQIEPLIAKLPAIPIPTFSGKVWEFENFWTLFEANVHNQPLTNLQKFNYLISALRGEAKDSVRRFNVTEGNYEKAVMFLHNKYGDESRLIDSLHTRLENARAENSSLEEQRRLLETILPIVSQLQDKGVSLDGSFLSQKVLSKFRVDLQRKVLEFCVGTSTQSQSWVLSDILSHLDKVITKEERINYMVNKNPCHNSAVPAKGFKSAPHNRSAELIPCLFCNATSHKSIACAKYATIEECSKIFRDTNRCLNCGTVGHFLTDCQRAGCKFCNGKKHHHTLCPLRVNQSHCALPQQTPTTGKSHIVSKAGAGQQQKSIRHVEGQRSKKPIRAHAHILEMDSPSEPPNALQVEDASPETGTVFASSHYREASSEYPDTPEPTANNVLLLTGVAQVRDTQRNQWKNVEILLDTGADESFITDTLANELGLERTTTKIFHVYTFGTEQPKRIACNLTTLGLWDRTGIKHNMRLHTLPVITKANKSARLSTEDLAFIKQRQIPLSKAHHEGTSKPQILIGCDQLWSLLDVSHPRYTLPSGRHLIPSKLGYLLTGKQTANQLQEGTQKLFDGEIKVKPATVNTFVNFEMDSEEDIDRWDKYWAMDSAGICEFTGTKNAEKNAINEEVARFFEETIEKRPDGYYIRFPFKKNHPPLPSNRAIAMKRLHSVFHMLQKTPQLLQDYNNIIVSQQELGIIEPISEKSSGEGSLVHYIPHQPVITPQKETTKLRIVFDASAHFKDCPSLNDILHQGPLILPELYAMLLRFRVAPYVVISDVEKAFLQVRLQEIDRDVTRFLWVRDISTPLDDSNIIAYRFTRVTFGLNVSPYLLGGTIHHHLRCAVSDADLAKEIRENLYVDNLILSGETPEEVAKKSLTARKLFSEMGMNLREFTSNDLSLRNKLPEEACFTPSPKKVLGILWDAQDDSLIMRCSLPPSNTITKRLVARQIASIYDPFGWLVPLITPAKRFQQDLWRQRIQWDTELPSDTRRKWETITNNINGFSRLFPRRFCASSDKLDLAVFADASEIALATCAYLFNSSTSTLDMAKSKLPSIKAKTTIPKLEMNAVTMAMRLTHSIVRALNSQQSACPKTVYVFSDSQIALSWLSSPKCTNVGVLVENRVREIREIVRYLSEKESVNAIFGYVHTSQNPADAGTRGLDKQQISDSDWWAGPEFLRAPICTWPVEFYPSVMTQDPTQDEAANQDTAHITAAYTTTTATSELLDWCRFSSFLAGTRVTALALRFVKKILRPLDTSNSLSSAELEAAKKVLFRDHQFT